MMHVSRARSLGFAFLACALSACSGSSSDDGTTFSLAVTDAATEELSTFTIGLESVELMSATGAPVSLLQIPTAVDFAALTDLSRVLNVADITPDTYTGVEVTLLFDGNRVHVNGENQPAALVDSSDNPLAGTLTLLINFPVPLDVTTGNYVIELDLDLSQSADVDAVNNKVVFEPTIVPRVNGTRARDDAKEHAVGGDLRTVVLAKNLFRIALEAPLGVAQPVVEVATGPGTVFQIDGVCMLGAAGLSALETLPVGSWAQAFGSVDASSRRFQAATVEAGSGSYNGGTDIVEGVIIDRTGGAGADAVLTVLGHSNNADHSSLQFNLQYTVNTSFTNTKVVRRGFNSDPPFTTDLLNVGQKVRMFGALTIGPPNVLDVTLATDVVRMEPTWVFGLAKEVPTNGQPFEIDLLRVDLRDVGDFTWIDGGTTPADPANFALDNTANLAGAQGIALNTPVVASGFFSAVDDVNEDFVPSKIGNRELLPSLLLIRDRANGTIVTTNTTGTSIDYTFSADPPVTFEKAVIDMGFAGQIDVTGTGISIVQEAPLGLGVYVIRDLTLDELSLFFTFNSFYQALDTKLLVGAQIFNVGALGVYNKNNDTVPSALVGVTVR